MSDIDIEKYAYSDEYLDDEVVIFFSNFHLDRFLQDFLTIIKYAILDLKDKK